MPNIVDKITDYLNKYMVFANEDQPVAVALWVLHTWTFSESFPRGPWTTPYLYVHSSESRSGKTLLIDLLEPIVLNPERTVDMTSSVMFRLIESVHPTLCIDEVDTVWSGAKNEGLRGVLNGGYKRSGYVWRNVPGPDGPEPTKFQTFSPKLLAGIDNEMLPETVASRCIPIKLTRKPDEVEREIFYAFMAEPEAQALVAEIEAFITEWKAHYTDYLPEPIKGINPRAWEIAMPLVQIAHHIGIESEVRERLARLLAPRPEKDSQEVAALRTIQRLFDETGAEKLHTKVICDALGEGWNGKLLNNRLKRFDIGNSTTLNIGNRAAKGYYKHQFTDAFARFL